ncbi:hypothetical protein D3C76_47770 [compost metagenome]
MPEPMKPGPERIFLAPKCHEDSPEGRHWCEDDNWGECDGCGERAVEYVRADLAGPADQVLVPRSLLAALLDGDSNLSLVAAQEIRGLLKESPE